MRIRTRVLLVHALAALATAPAGCSDDTGIPEACNPLGGMGCMLPWPSMAYVEADAATATGYRLAIPREAMPANFDGLVIEPDALNRWDGFSAIGPSLAMFPTGVSSEGLPGHRDPSASLAPGSPVVMVNLDTGQRSPCFAEVDANATDPAKAALIIRPLVRLAPGSHYAVAIRNTVKDAAGAPLVAPPGFAAMRDGDSFDHPRFAAASKRAPELFAGLEAAGVPREELVLAWDFVTVSDEYIRRDLTAMRAQALPAIGAAGANLSFTAAELPPRPLTYRRYLGTYKAPDFLTAGETDASSLRRDADHLPVASGLRDARYAAIIPNCVQTQPLPRPAIIFGHGLFGSAEGYLDDSFVESLAEDHCFIILAGDFIGLTERQLTFAPLVINDLNRASQLTDKLAQSIVDFMALESITRGPLAASAQFRFNNQPVIDPARVYYVGGSLGGIMGNTLLAYDPNFERGVLAVPGGNWSMLFERSAAWEILLGSHQGAYEDPEIQQLTLALALGMAFESVDPMTTAAHVIKDPLFGQAPKNVLIWYALGDSLVTNIATEMILREMGIPLLGPTVKTPFGMTAMTGTAANGAVVYDEKRTPAPFETNQPQEDNGTHSGINKKPAPMRQVQKFLLPPFVASQECRTGAAPTPVPCDCTTGACN